VGFGLDHSIPCLVCRLSNGLNSAGRHTVLYRMVTPVAATHIVHFAIALGESKTHAIYKFMKVKE